MSWPYRCTRECCRQRRALHKRKDLYRRTPLCPGCGHDSLKLDRWKKNNHWQALCHCGTGMWFPHRRGSFGCAAYSGPRTPERDHNEQMARDLGATDTIHDAARAPF